MQYSKEEVTKYLKDKRRYMEYLSKNMYMNLLDEIENLSPEKEYETVLEWAKTNPIKENLDKVFENNRTIIAQIIADNYCVSKNWELFICDNPDCECCESKNICGNSQKILSWLYEEAE